MPKPIDVERQKQRESLLVNQTIATHKKATLDVLEQYRDLSDPATRAMLKFIPNLPDENIKAIVAYEMSNGIAVKADDWEASNLENAKIAYRQGQVDLFNARKKISGLEQIKVQMQSHIKAGMPWEGIIDGWGNNTESARQTAKKALVSILIENPDIRNKFKEDFDFRFGGKQVSNETRKEWALIVREVIQQDRADQKQNGQTVAAKDYAQDWHQSTRGLASKIFQDSVDQERRAEKRQERRETYESIQKHITQYREKPILLARKEANRIDKVSVDFLVQANDYVGAKRELARQLDLRKGIVTQHVPATTENGLKTDVYLRDAREPRKLQGVPWENYAIMVLSHMQIAKRMIDMEIDSNPNMGQVDKNNAKKNVASKFAKISGDFIQEIQKSKSELDAQDCAYRCIKKITPVLADNLKISKKEAATRMKKFKDYGNMDEKPYALVTMLPDINGKGVDQIDIPIVELTEEQQKDYKAIRDSKAGEAGLPDWYTAKKPAEQAMIKSYAPAILEGRVIPTQLFGISGTRNAYQSIDDVRTKNANGYVSIATSESHRSGNIAEKPEKQGFFKNLWQAMFGSPEDSVNVQLTLQAMKQHMAATGCTRLYIQSTVSPVPGLGEGEFHRYAKEAAALFNKEAEEKVSPERVIYANTPLNLFRWFYAWNDRTIENSVSNDTLKILRQNITDCDDAIKASLSGKTPTLEFENSDLSFEQKQVLKSQFDVYMTLQRVQSGILPRWRNQDNAQRMSATAQMNDLNNQFGDLQEKAGKPRTVPYAIYDTTCKSGKDRTGWDLFAESFDSICRNVFGNSKSTSERMTSKEALAPTQVQSEEQQPLLHSESKHEDKQASEYMGTMALAGHTQELAGGQGGSMGAKGIKNSWWKSNLLPYWAQTPEIEGELVTNAAENNKKVKKVVFFQKWLAGSSEDKATISNSPDDVSSDGVFSPRASEIEMKKSESSRVPSPVPGGLGTGAEVAAALSTGNSDQIVEAATNRHIRFDIDETAEIEFFDDSRPTEVARHDTLDNKPEKVDGKEELGDLRDSVSVAEVDNLITNGVRASN